MKLSTLFALAFLVYAPIAVAEGSKSCAWPEMCGEGAWPISCDPGSQDCAELVTEPSSGSGDDRTGMRWFLSRAGPSAHDSIAGVDLRWACGVGESAKENDITCGWYYNEEANLDSHNPQEHTFNNKMEWSFHPDANPENQVEWNMNAARPDVEATIDDCSGGAFDGTFVAGEDIRFDLDGDGEFDEDGDTFDDVLGRFRQESPDDVIAWTHVLGEVTSGAEIAHVSGGTDIFTGSDTEACVTATPSSVSLVSDFRSWAYVWDTVSHQLATWYIDAADDDDDDRAISVQARANGNGDDIVRINCSGSPGDERAIICNGLVIEADANDGASNVLRLGGDPDDLVALYLRGGTFDTSHIVFGGETDNRVLGPSGYRNASPGDYYFHLWQNPADGGLYVKEDDGDGAGLDAPSSATDGDRILTTALGCGVNNDAVCIVATGTQSCDGACGDAGMTCDSTNVPIIAIDLNGAAGNEVADTAPACGDAIGGSVDRMDCPCVW